MKNLCFLGLFFLLFKGIIAQNYTPMPTANAIWVDYLQYQYGAQQANDCKTVSTEIVGDTILNGITYHILFQREYGYRGAIFQNQSCDQGTPYYTTDTIGYFRNDFINKKVYIRLAGDTVDRLLYDFDLRVGDNLSGTILYKGPPPIPGLWADTVLRIRRLMYGNISRQVFEISDSICNTGVYPTSSSPNYLNGALIEGIGHSHGFLFGHSCGLGDRSYLKCFSKDGKVVYPDSTFPCNIVTSKVEWLTKNTKTKVYPNPSDGVFKIDGSSPIESLMLFDIQGRLISELVVQKNIWYLPEENGLYIIQIRYRNGVVENHKISKQ